MTGFRIPPRFVSALRPVVSAVAAQVQPPANRVVRPALAEVPGARDGFDPAPRELKAGLPDLGSVRIRPQGVAHDELVQTKQGRDALRYAREHGVKIEYGEKGKGTYYNPSENRIVVDPSVPPSEQDKALIHEVNHARHQLEGAVPDARSTGKKEWVNRRLNEEARGESKAIEHERAQAKQGEDVDTRSDPLERKYDNAYDRAVARYREAHPDASSEKLDSVGKWAGRDAVRDAWGSDSVITSNTRENYREYYGNAWDKANGRA
jgi:hypothetical protein